MKKNIKNISSQNLLDIYEDHLSEFYLDDYELEEFGPSTPQFSEKAVLIELKRRLMYYDAIKLLEKK